MNGSTGQMPPDVPQPDSPPHDTFQQSDQPDSKPQKVVKSRRTRWRITAVVLFLILVTGSLGFFVAFPALQEASLESTLQTYCDAYKKLDDAELESTFSSHFRAQPLKSEGDYIYEYVQIKGLGASFTSCTVRNIQQNGSTATALVTIILQAHQDQSDTATERVSLTLENGPWNWKVNDIQHG